jgi:hypothetical protein
MTRPQNITTGQVSPIGMPSRTELWHRVQLARSVLEHRALTPDTKAVVLRVLDGDRIEDLVE